MIASALCVHAGRAHDENLILHYDKPATNWEREALPIGNGQMGAMIFGGTDEEEIQFNEESLWIGNEEDTGAYQNFGEVRVKVEGAGAVSDYRRELDLNDAVHRVTYNRGGIRYFRECFADAPSKVIVVRFTADKPGSISGLVMLEDAHAKEYRLNYTGNPIAATPQDHQYGAGTNPPELSMTGCFPGYDYGQGKHWLPLRREARVRVLPSGGTISVQGEFLRVEHADSLTLILAAGTDFKQDRASNWRGELPHSAVVARLEAATAKGFDALRSQHVADYRSLFDRVTLSLGGRARPDVTTDVRRKQYDPANPDLGLEELMFQYGRYLMISSSRRGGLPANLQGKWNNNNTPPWRCDYHTDVNVQMNYWMADVANLGECFEPFASWLTSIREVRKEETARNFKVRGWAIKGESGLFGGSTWNWVPGANAWLLQNLYDHYRFTGDKEYLRTTAYPAMKEVCEYWLDSLVAKPDGTLVTPRGLSPEHGPVEEGVSFDQQLVWDLFNNTVEAADVLGIDKEFRDQLSEKQSRLLPPRIGKWGQLQEWMVDRDDPNDHHRHTSHLIAVFPGRQISPLTTPELAKAAAVSLGARGETGDSAREWAYVWRAALWARLGEGNKAHAMLTNLIKHGCMPNLLCTHPPFQIDGNFGYVAGVCEMLLQSQNRTVDLLPALPKCWSNGSFWGLRARGGIVVDAGWREGKITDFKATSLDGRSVTIRKAGIDSSVETMKMDR